MEAKEGAGREEAQMRGRALRKVQGRGGGVEERERAETALDEERRLLRKPRLAGKGTGSGSECTKSAVVNQIRRAPLDPFSGYVAKA